MATTVVNNFEGATHVNLATREAVKATCWAKDGAHPAVERYPIERREYKGLLVVGPKEKYALRFGDWVIEDGAGRITIKSPEQFEAAFAALEAQQ